ncbi:MAG: High-affinity branched-chain amino acid transport ATP-binding protein LivF [candidate division BRC1 bacterium ADurb.BinA364]|nr:MAG: High-affinity branched-chain amino acid transport ATP-binding protein LivF [candidate division BRC1 bacterium ADurb.BinA364]
MLEIANLEAGYGALKILKGINLKIERNTIVALIGANGAGKTTTLQAICGIVRAQAGRIVFEGEDLTRLSTQEIVERGVSQAPEGRKLFSDMTVAENLEMGAFARRNRKAIAGDMDYVFSLFPILRDRRRQRAGSLSGGEQQMCAIARALMARPRLLLLDEPSLGLAPLLVEKIFEIIQSINKEGMTIFLVEQNAHMSLSIASMGYVMATGEIALCGPGRELLNNDDVRRTYLGEL